MERLVLRGFLYVVLVLSSIGVVGGMSTPQRTGDGEYLVPLAFAVGCAAALAISARPEAQGRLAPRPEAVTRTPPRRPVPGAERPGGEASRPRP